MGAEIVFSVFPIEAVPKFTVAKNGNLFSDKSDVRLAENCFDIFSVAQTSSPKFFSQLNFDIGISAFDLSHVVRNLFFSFFHGLRFPNSHKQGIGCMALYTGIFVSSGVGNFSSKCHFV